jgi:filamentous hemagglutinin family protein
MGGTALVFLAASTNPAVAGGTVLPQGGGFAKGSGTISQSGSQLTINQSGPSGIINWQSFSIGAGGTVQFNNGSGATLNRVTGGDPSQIFGSLKATGSVFLLNPNGIVIGQSGTVVAGGSFVASTLNLQDTAFMNGGPFAFKGASSASVQNNGAITASGGDVLLIAHPVTNAGSIAAPEGKAALVAGQEVLLHDLGADDRVFVRVAGGDVTNSGSIAAAQAELKATGGNVYALAFDGGGGSIRATGTATRAGHVWLTARAGNVKNDGTIAATNADGSGGAVTVAAKNGTVQNTGRIVAAGTSGGKIKVKAKNVLNQGTVNADGTTGTGGSVTVAYTGAYNDTESAVISARGAGAGGTVAVTGGTDTSAFVSGRLLAGSTQGTGGTVEVLGDTLQLQGARLDASGATGGGALRVGGGFHGGEGLFQASQVTVGASSVLSADAITMGNGGTSRPDGRLDGGHRLRHRRFGPDVADDDVTDLDEDWQQHHHHRRHHDQRSGDRGQ